MTGSRAGIVVLARNGSSRLPRKSLLEICGTPILKHQLNRLKQSKRTVHIVLATTTLSEDDSLCRLATAEGIQVFRGSQLDVVRRLYDAAIVSKLNFLVVVGGDDILIEGQFIDQIIDHHDRTGDDFVTMEKKVPFGAAPYGVSAIALQRVIDLRADEASDGWERFFTETSLFKASVIAPADAELFNFPDLRVTLDYPEDYELLRVVYERLFDGAVPPLSRIIQLLVDEEPQLAKINAEAHARWLLNSQVAWPPLRFKVDAGGVS